MTREARRFMVIACVSLALASALGAFGTHALESRLTPQRLRSFDTAVTYQFFHSLGLLGVGLLLRDHAHRWLVGAGWMLVAGMALFAGSIYAITFGAPRAVVVFAPIGGATLISAWTVAALAIFQQRK